MTVYSFPVTIGAASVNLAAAAIAAGAVINGYTAMYSSRYLPAAKVLVQVAPGGTGQIFVGGSNLTAAGANKWFTLSPNVTTTLPGDKEIIASENDHNNQDLGQWWVNGTHATDVATVTYWQE